MDAHDRIDRSQNNSIFRGLNKTKTKKNAWPAALGLREYGSQTSRAHGLGEYEDLDKDSVEINFIPCQVLSRVHFISNTGS